MARAAGTPYLCAHGAAERSGGEGAEPRRGAGRAVRPAGSGLSRRLRGVIWRDPALAAGSGAVAAEAASRTPLKGRSHSWGVPWPMGGGRAGSGRGPVSVPLSAPCCLAHNFPARK